MPNDIKEKLLKVGKSKGYISIAFLTAIVPEEKDPTYIDELFALLSENNIEIITQEEQLQRKAASEVVTSLCKWAQDNGPTRSVAASLGYYTQDLPNMISRFAQDLLSLA